MWVWTCLVSHRCENVTHLTTLTHYHLIVVMAAVLASSCLFKHPAGMEQHSIHLASHCGHLANMSPIYTLLLALFLFSTNSWKIYLALQQLNSFHCVHQPVTIFVCVPLGAWRQRTVGLSEPFSLKTAADESGESELNSKPEGCKPQQWAERC